MMVMPGNPVIDRRVLFDVTARVDGGGEGLRMDFPMTVWLSRGGEGGGRTHLI